MTLEISLEFAIWSGVGIIVGRRKVRSFVVIQPVLSHYFFSWSQCFCPSDIDVPCAASLTFAFENGDIETSLQKSLCGSKA